MNGDTVRGMIANINSAGLIFKDSFGHRDSLYPSKVKAFHRAGFDYKLWYLPDQQRDGFLAHLQKGRIDLYACIIPETGSVAGATMAGLFFGGIIGGVLAYSISSSVSHASSGKSANYDKYYNVCGYYVRKNPLDSLLVIPKGNRKFTALMYKLMSDEKDVIRSIADDAFIYENLPAIIMQYNAYAEQMKLPRN
jgi:hypothetical protein